jgi:hypothetical protein
MKKSLGMPRRQDEKEGDHDQGNRAPISLRDQPSKSQEQERERRRGGRERVPEIKHQIIAERPGDRSCEGGDLAAPQFLEEEICGEKGEQVPQSHLEGPGLRERGETRSRCG